MASSNATAAAVRKVYRQLYHILKQQPSHHSGASSSSALQELRTSFRRPLETNETLADRLGQAESRLAFLRITTVKTKPRGETGTWVYKDGERLTNVGGGTIRDSKGRVVSSFDGKNLDPEAVKRHRQVLYYCVSGKNILPCIY